MICCRHLCIIICCMASKFSATVGDGEFRTYHVQELFSGCLSTKTSISMLNDWIFSGQIIYNGEDMDTPSSGICNNRSYQLTILADLSDSLEALKLMFRVQNEYSIEDKGRRANVTSDTTGFRLFVSDGSTLNKSINLCPSCQGSEMFMTSTDELTLTFDNLQDPLAKWSLTFTAYHTGLCRSYEYMCANKRCIFHSLSCNGLDPCGDLSDCKISPAAYATIAFGGFCALCVIFLILYLFVKSRKSSVWSSREPRKYKFSATKALEGLQSFTPATVSIEPLKRRWSYKY